MKYDFIEIGTSDFRTIIQTCPEKSVGLSIDPLKFYLDRLPIKENVKKINCAISDKDSTGYIYWVKPEDIEKYNLPNWIRGCNSINQPHPSTLIELSKRSLPNDIITKDEVEFISFNTLIKKFNIQSVSYLKIDTEGHDAKILKSLFSSDNLILPDKIEFEANILSSENEIQEVLEIFKKHDYVVIKRTDADIIVERKVNDKLIIYNVSSFEREETLIRTIDSIYRYSDYINISLNSYNKIPDKLIDPKIRIFRTNNELGDAYKFINVDKIRGFYFTIDDDLIYPENYTNYMIEKYTQYKDKIITLHGRNFYGPNFISYYKSATEKYRCTDLVEKDTKVIFGGTGVMMAHTDLFRGLDIGYFKRENMADIWISKWASENNTEIICCQHQANWIKYQYVKKTIYDIESKNDEIQTKIAKEIIMKHI